MEGKQVELIDIYNNYVKEGGEGGMNGVEQPFWVIVNKEIRDHVRSWRFIIFYLPLSHSPAWEPCIHHSPACMRLSNRAMWKMLFLLEIVYRIRWNIAFFFFVPSTF